MQWSRLGEAASSIRLFESSPAPLYHGIAVAYAARKLGVPVEIYVPSLATALKRKMLTDLGAKVVVAGDTYVEALAASQARAFETGALNIHAFDRSATVAASLSSRFPRRCAWHNVF